MRDLEDCTVIGLYPSALKLLGHFLTEFGEFLNVFHPQNSPLFCYGTSDPN